MPLLKKAFIVDVFFIKLMTKAVSWASFENRPVHCEVGVIGSKKSLLDLLAVSNEIIDKLPIIGRYYKKPEVYLTEEKQSSVCSVVFEGEYNRYTLVPVIKSAVSKHDFAAYYSIKLLKETTVLRQDKTIV